MASRFAALAAGSVTLLSLAVVPAWGDTLYFHNKRAIQADSWETKGHLIYVTMGGKTVYMKADSVDWETTEKLKQSGIQLEKVDYSVVDGVSEEDAGTAGTGHGGVLTAADLRKVGSGYKMRRAAAPGLSAEVPAEAGWTDSGVNVRAGQTLGIRSTGRVNVSQGKETGPEGLPTPGGAADALLSDQPHGALLVRVGPGGDVRVLGRATSFTAPASGRLYLSVNDKTPLDNSGSFSVRIELPAPPAVPSSMGNPGAPSGSGPASSSAATGQSTAGSSNKVQQGMMGGIGRAQNARDSAKGASSSQRDAATGE